MNETGAATPRNHELDGLRGYAALAVVVYHAVLGIEPTQIQSVLQPSFRQMSSAYEIATKTVLAVFNGEVAVTIFFIMSGAVLLQSLQREIGNPAVIAGRFFIRRILRIYPVLIACLILALLIYPYVGLPADLHLFLSNLMLKEFPLLGASWTLQVEMAAVPMLIAGGLVFRKWREAGLLIFLILTLTLLRHTALGRVVPQASWFGLCFAFGMLIPTRCGANIARLTPLWSWPALLITALLVRHFQPFSFNTNVTVQFAAAALLVNAIYFQPAPALSVALGSRKAVFYGRISYTMYLANLLFLEPIRHVLGGYAFATTHPLEVGLVLGLIVLLLTIPTAYLLTIAVEEPAIRLGRLLTRQRQHVSPDPAAAAVRQ